MSGRARRAAGTVQVRQLAMAPAWPVVLPLCRNLQVVKMVDRLCPMRGYAHVSHGQVVELLLLHLLQAPQRLPLYRLQDWAHQYHLDRLYGCPPDAFNDDRIGRTLDALAPVIAEVETAVVTEALRRYRIDVSAVHWDLTHLTFAGVHEGWDLIGPGYGAGAIHARQVKVSLHATGDGGLPVHHQLLSGGAHQAPHAPALLAEVQRRVGRTNLIVVADSAGISYDTLVAYRRAGAQCLAPLSATPAERAQVAAVPPQQFRELAYRSRHAPEDRYFGYETTLTVQRQKRREPLVVRARYVYSPRRAAKEAAERAQHLQRTLAKLERLRHHLNRRRFARAEYVRHQLEHKIPAALRAVVHAEVSGADGQLALEVRVDEAARAAAAAGDGRYILIADVAAASADDVFQRFKDQALLERRFRNLKSELSVHPLWLQDEDRIRALVLVCVLALLVYALLERCSERAGLSTRYYHKMTARELIYAFGMVLLSEVRIRGQPPEYHLELTPEQQALLDQLGFPDPDCYLQHP